MTEEVAAIALVGLFLMVIIAILGARLTSIERRVVKLSSVDAKLDLLLQQAGIKYDPYKGAPAGVMEAIREGRKIEAIKCYREATGAGLKESKDFVEALQRRAGVS